MFARRRPGRGLHAQWLPVAEAAVFLNVVSVEWVQRLAEAGTLVAADRDGEVVVNLASLASFAARRASIRPEQGRCCVEVARPSVDSVISTTGRPPMRVRPEQRDRKGRSARGGLWMTLSEVARHLGVDPRTVRARMDITPDHINKPWVNWGTEKCPKYGWKSDSATTWWEEVGQWRTSRSVGGNTGSAGETGRGSGATGPVRTGGRRRESGGRLSRPSQKAGDGTLTQFVRNLPSKDS